MAEKSIKNIRQEFKDKGIFYTPTALAEKIKSYVDIELESVYDPTCGAGNLLRVFPDDVMKYGQELDAEQLALVDCKNFMGYAGDTLTDDGFKGMTFDAIVANPPFSIKWNPDALKDDPRFWGIPAMPPPSKADWAFMLHIINHLSEGGVAVVLSFPGILYRGQREYKVRRWFIENNYIDRIVNISPNTFEDTSIATCIVVMKKRRETTDITFEDGERSICAPFEVIAENDFTLSLNMYLPDDAPKEEIDIDEVNAQVVLQLLQQVELTVESLVSLSEVFVNDNSHIDELMDGLQRIVDKYQDWAVKQQEVKRC